MLIRYILSSFLQDIHLLALGPILFKTTPRRRYYLWRLWLLCELWWLLLLLLLQGRGLVRGVWRGGDHVHLLLAMLLLLLLVAVTAALGWGRRHRDLTEGGRHPALCARVL